MKIRPLGAEFFYADEQLDGRTDTDMTKLIVVFRNFAKAPNNCIKGMIAATANSVLQSLSWEEQSLSHPAQYRSELINGFPLDAA
jgi:hypothetical protein